MMINLFNRNLSKVDDYRNIWTKFCFLDESGSLHSPDAPFFTIGIIKLSEPFYLNTIIQKERDKYRFYDEIKFNKLSNSKIAFVTNLFDIFIQTRSVQFYSRTVDKDGDYFKRHFDSDPWKAYEEITIETLCDAVIAPNEIITLLADDVKTPDKYQYEITVEKTINDKFHRLAVAGVCRLNSKSNDLLQLTDLIIGGINYSLKLETGVTKSGDKYKRRFAKHMTAALNPSNPKLINGFRDKKFNIFVDKDIQKRLTQTQKGQSS